MKTEPMRLPCTHSSTRIPAACSASVVKLAFSCKGLNGCSSPRNSPTGTIHSTLMISNVRSRAVISTSASRTASSP